MADFDDTLLEDAAALSAGDGVLRPLAETGAWLRREMAHAEPLLASLAHEGRPRAVVAIGPEARLLRALLEPSCPVPFVAWPNLGLPGWVGPLDVVVVLGGTSMQPRDCVHEALRRGARLIVTARPGSPLAVESESRLTTLLPVTTVDPLVRAVVALEALHELGLAAPVDSAGVATALDAVAADCSHARDVTVNPAKLLALEFADVHPLIWGGSVLAARASRRIAEGFRSATGQVALAADAAALAPLLADADPRDLFSDPFESPVAQRPRLLVIDDGLADAAAVDARRTLEGLAEAADVAVSVLSHTQGTDLERYVTVLQRGRFASGYLAIGCRRVPAGR